MTEELVTPQPHLLVPIEPTVSDVDADELEAGDELNQDAS